MFGRGRGRIMSEDGLGVPPRRPGAAPSSAPSAAPAKPASSRAALEKLSALERLFRGPVEDLVVFQLLHDYLEVADAPHDLDRLVETVTSRLLGDASNSDHVAKYLWVLSKKKAPSGEVLLRKFFTRLEEMFSGPEKYGIVVGGARYRNFVALFSSVAHLTRNRLYPPFDDLIDGLYRLLLPLLDSDHEDDLALLAVAVVRYSGYLRMEPPPKKSPAGDVDAITVAMRKKIESRGRELSEAGVGWLLFGLEASRVGLEGLSDAVRLHYVSLLGHAVYCLAPKNERIRLPSSAALRYALEELQPGDVILL